MADMTSSTPVQKSVLMIAYTNYYYDARVRREAETLVQTEQFRVTFLTLRTGEHKKMFDLAGVRVIELNQRGYQGNSKVFYIFSYIEFLIRAFLKCTWLFFKGRIDIVHVHNMPDFLVFAALVPRMFGRKLILDIHDSVPETYLSKFTDRPSLLYKLLVFLEAACIAVAHKIICVNHVQKEILVGRGVPPAKITISINTPDPLLFPINRAPAAIQTSNSFFRLVYHGTIAERLGIDLTVRALARLCSRIPNLEFHLWGPTGPTPAGRLHLHGVLWPLLVLSLLANKHAKYLLPAYPAAAALLGLRLADFAQHSPRRWRVLAAGAVLLLAGWVGYYAFGEARLYRYRYAGLGELATALRAGNGPVLSLMPVDARLLYYYGAPIPVVDAATVRARAAHGPLRLVVENARDPGLPDGIDRCATERFTPYLKRRRTAQVLMLGTHCAPERPATCSTRKSKPMKSASLCASHLMPANSEASASMPA